MYEGGKGGGDLVAPIIPTAAGIAVLPNTGGNQLLFIVSLVSTIVGVTILLTTLARMAAKRYYKA